jgi:hypothetical protein
LTAPIVLASFRAGIYALLGRFADALRAHGAPLQSVRAYIFGACAMHLYAVSTRCSGELELELTTTLVSDEAIHAAKRDAGIVLVRRPADEDPELLELNLVSNRTPGPLHSEFAARARLLPVAPDAPLVVFLPSPEDLALSMLDRFSEIDAADIRVLMNRRDASWEVLATLAADVEKHYRGVPDSLIRKVEELKQPKAVAG